MAGARLYTCRQHNSSCLSLAPKGRGRRVTSLGPYPSRETRERYSAEAISRAEWVLDSLATCTTAHSCLHDIF
jgi:hypothetical protein